MYSLGNCYCYTTSLTVFERASNRIALEISCFESLTVRKWQWHWQFRKGKLKVRSGWKKWRIQGFSPFLVLLPCGCLPAPLSQPQPLPFALSNHALPRNSWIQRTVVKDHRLPSSESGHCSHLGKRTNRMKTFLLCKIHLTNKYKYLKNKNPISKHDQISSLGQPHMFWGFHNSTHSRTFTRPLY